jgi:hypothetical protein
VEALQQGRYDREMRRLLTWIVVTLGIAAIARRLRRRERPEELAPARSDDDPADELRRKLAETRSEEEAPAEPPVSTEPSPEASVEARRANVHEEGRAALDEMREPDEG